jgi:hypothetical protein
MPWPAGHKGRGKVGRGHGISAASSNSSGLKAFLRREFMILKKVMRPRLITLFAGVVTIGFIIVGYVFNAVM